MDPAAYEAYLRGRLFFERGTEQDLETAIGRYQEAVRLHPNYARAWAGLAIAYGLQADQGYVPPKEGFARGREAVERALALDPDLADAHANLGWIKMSHDWDWAGPASMIPFTTQSSVRGWRPERDSGRRHQVPSRRAIVRDGR